MTFKNKVIAGFGSALAILILVGILSYRRMIRTDEDREWVEHTHLVMEKLDAVLTNMLDIETGERGYILVGEPAFLKPYSLALDRVRQNLKDIRDLTGDNPAQRRALDRLEPLVSERLGTARDEIGLRTREGLAAGAESVRANTGKQSMDQIRDTLAGMTQEENRLFKLRKEEAAKSSRYLRIVIVTGQFLAVAFLCFAGTMVGQEIGQRRRSEEEVLKLNADLEQRVAERTEELNERAKDLTRSNSELQQFAYVASHDLQEPLRMVASFTQLLAKRYGDKLDDDAREFINYAVDGAMRMQTLISDLLSYSRIGTQGKQLELTNSDALFKKVLDSLQLGIQESGAEIVSDPMPMVMADPRQLGQLFQNLLTNAIKFKGEAPIRIKISVERSGSNWKISVRDNGIGISQEHAERIFIIFQRLHTKTEYPGTGIGLAICKKIVELHGGRIWIEPSPGGGTTFCFTIPAVENHDLRGREQNELRVPAYAS
jgi:signal transduction histidine kinase